MWLLLLGCPALIDDCSATCDRLYDEEACNIQRPGRDQQGLIDLCLDECREADRQLGDVGDYDPFERSESNVAVELENSAQVALWAQCVEETSCDDISDGLCAPVW